MRKILPYLLILFVALFAWYYKRLPKGIKRGFGKALAWIIILLWIYLVLRFL